MSTVKSTTINEYIAAFPPEVKKALEQVYAVIKQVAPDAEESISYAIPTFKLKGKPLIYFAAFKSHIGSMPPLPGMQLLKRNYPNTSKERVRCNFL